MEFVALERVWVTKVHCNVHYTKYTDSIFRGNKQVNNFIDLANQEINLGSSFRKQLANSLVVEILYKVGEVLGKFVEIVL